MSIAQRDVHAAANTSARDKLSTHDMAAALGSAQRQSAAASDSARRQQQRVQRRTQHHTQRAEGTEGRGESEAQRAGRQAGSTGTHDRQGHVQQVEEQRDVSGEQEAKDGGREV